MNVSNKESSLINHPPCFFLQTLDPLIEQMGMIALDWYNGCMDWVEIRDGPADGSSTTLWKAQGLSDVIMLVAILYGTTCT